MFFWRIERLKERLAERPLTTREELPYLMVLVGIGTLLVYTGGWPGDIAILVDALVNVTIGLLGTMYVYRLNGGRSGEWFLQRYFAVGWVVSVRLLVFLILPLLIIYGVGGYFGYDSSEYTPWYETVVFWLLGGFAYYRAGQHVRDVAVRTLTVGDSSSLNSPL